MEGLLPGLASRAGYAWQIDKSRGSKIQLILSQYISVLILSILLSKTKEEENCYATGY